MKVKNIKVEIRSLKSFLDEAAKAMKDIRKGRKVNNKRGLSFSDVETFRKFFTPKRLELLKVIKNKNPGSVYQLSKLLKRDIKSVTTDLKILSDYGLIDLKKKPSNSARYKIKPVFSFDKIVVEVDI